MRSEPIVGLSAYLFLVSLFLLPIFEGGNGSISLLLGLALVPALFLVLYLLGEVRPSQVCLSAVVLFALVSILTSTYTYPTLKNLCYLISGITAFVLSAHFCKRMKVFSLVLLGVMSFSALVISLYGLFLLSAKFPQISFENQLSSTFGLHNSFAAFLLLVWPLPFTLAGVRRSLVFYLIGVILPLTLLLTFSRASYIAFFIQLFYLLGTFLLSFRPKLREIAVAIKKNLVPFSFTLALICLALVLLAFTTFYSALAVRIHSIFNLLDYSLQGRLTFWRVSWLMFRRFPLFGVGYGNFGYHYPYLQPSWHYYATDAHGTIFQALSEGGVFGIIFLLLGLILFFKGSMKSSREQSCFLPWQRTLVSSSLIGFFLHSLVDFDFTYLANVSYFGAICGLFLSDALDYGRFARRSLRSVFSLRGLAINVLAFIVSLGLVLSVFAGYLFAKERSLLDRARHADDPRPLLEKSLSYFPFNTSVRIDLVLNELASRSLDYHSIHQQLETILRQNPFESQGYFLMSQLPNVSYKERIIYGRKAIELDPFNRPFYYLGLSRLYREIGDEEGELNTLLIFSNRYADITDKITPDFPRPNWIEYNITFATVYRRLSELILKRDKSLSRHYFLLSRKFSEGAS